MSFPYTGYSAFTKNGAGSALFITNVQPQSDGSVYGKQYEPDTVPANKVLTGFSTDTPLIEVFVQVEGGGANYTPKVYIGETKITNLYQPAGADVRVFKGSADINASGLNSITARDNNSNSVSVTINIEEPPVVTECIFTEAAYPNGQTELKKNDTATIQVTADKAFNRIQIADYEAGTAKTVSVTEDLTATCSVDIADRGDSAVLRPVKVKVITSNESVSEYYDSSTAGDTEHVNKVMCNNLYPTMDYNSITYPTNQEALKGSESADIDIEIINFDTVAYSSPNNQLLIPDSAVYNRIKTVTRLAGDYNISAINYKITATRAANNSSVEINKVIFIANVAPTITVFSPSRLRSGGNDGTAAQNHTITISSNQNLIEAPSLFADIGVWQGANFSGSAQSWSRNLQIDDDESKGAGTFSSLSATGLAGIEQTTISSGGSYTVGGFVSRTLILDAFQNIVEMNVAVIDTAKLSSSWSVKDLTFKSIGTSAPVPNGYTISALDTNPINVIVLDTAATSSRSQPSNITIEEVQ